jgi:16S rRNA (guanine527-N7)-methyltransferase
MAWLFGTRQQDRRWQMAAADGLDVLAAEVVRLGVVLDAVARARFAQYLGLLEEWRERAGLTTVVEAEEVQRRHFGEALALLTVVRGLPEVTGADGLIALADLGSGAGFPGLPMRIVEPRLRLTLVEAHGRRARFLELVVAALDLEDVRVVQARAEEAGRDPALRAAFDVVVARALAPLPVLVEYALPLLRAGGVLAAPKGSRVAEEIEAAAAAIEALGGTLEAVVSLPLPSDVPSQQVVLVRRTGALDDRYPRRPGVPSRRPL